ncbi:hypothetical protein [Flavobacterium suncheonense]|uniref:Uncharacterized protein n=1 Tax=Flavobacterium suncheonense GH29-5 = DSM 17707 TaxID=1121899 RepID=A0A0A2MFX1_9FLAO|nr:hypothetical protein [Flavobacterium suncheonense]KGO87170.1 hypothetical protein Q764_13015 [Flavobacterium suncheonense GH29-5 = DSM 17707]
MKKTVLLIALTLFTITGFSQKKKSTAKTKTETGVLAKTDNLTAEKVKNEVHVYVTADGKKELLFSKPVDAKNTLSEVKITGFKAKETPMYYISWTEKGTTKTDLKTEDATVIVSEIWDVATKTQMIGNVQSTTHIVEKVFLDKLKNASETQERMRREGFEFTLLPTGDFILKDKKSETKYTYNPTDKKFVAATAAAAPKKKK